VPGSKSTFLVVEQKTRKIWRFEEGAREHQKELFSDLSQEATTGDFEGVVCLAFHPRFLENRQYYVNYHVRNPGSFFSPVIALCQATSDLRRDAGGPSTRLLQIHQDTDLHWGGMLAFGPDGFLYIGAGDAGPQEDPDGHGQKVTIARAGENHGWNVYEGFMKFSDQYRREGQTYTPPVMAYRRKYGPSVTGGYVYRGRRNASYYGAYFFGDFESRRI
jgi:Glucose / Sorbosone dehydrogenase